jgi:hypothetical protein
MAVFKVINISETRATRISLCDDGIVRVMLKKNSEIGVQQAKENIQAYSDIAAGNKYAFIFYCENDNVVYSEEARTYAKNNEALFPKICMAVLVKTLAHKLVANFYFKFHKPAYPYKVFDKLADAEAWCWQQIDIYSRSEQLKATHGLLV